MYNKQLTLPFNRELIVDLFAGGGGASTGIEIATRRFVDHAINHDPRALAMHAANHSQTIHHCSDIREVDPLEVTKGQPVALLWASPDCRHFSKAKGAKPVSKKVRALGWVVPKWASTVRPRVIIVENVEEFEDWGPLIQVKPGKWKPDPKRKGETFKQWVAALEALGYKVEWRQLRACDYGAPTTRKRLFIVARCDGKPIMWPNPTHGDPKKAETKKKGLKPWHTAAECIDWSIPCPSIFDRKKSLSDNTLRRIAYGIVKYVIKNPKPFIVTNTTGHPGAALVIPVITSIANFSGIQARPGSEPLSTVTANPKGGHHALIETKLSPFVVGAGGPAYAGEPSSVEKPMGTVTRRNHKYVVAPTLITVGYGDEKGTRCPGLDKPLRTVVSQGNHHALVSAFLAKHYTGAIGSDLKEPIGSVTSIDHHSLVISHITKLRGKDIGHGTDEPLHTISAQGTHFGEIRALLVKYYKSGNGGAKLNEPMPTITTKDRMGLVIVKINGEPYAISDIGMRMLQPHELFAAQGFPQGYEFKKPAGQTKEFTKKEQVYFCGNSVSPAPAAAVVSVNCDDIE